MESQNWSINFLFILKYNSSKTNIKQHSLNSVDQIIKKTIINTVKLNCERVKNANNFKGTLLFLMFYNLKYNNH